ncbi:MAG: L-threonylcarbamoyladenylate synthase [Bacillota bacterium]
MTEVLAVDPLRPAAGAIARAASIIAAGGTVAFPTETVYGLGANGLDPDAVARVFRAKGRPQDNPVILHVADADGLKPLVEDVALPLALELAGRFWPGPLTLVLRRSPIVPAVVSAGLPTVGVRVPAHPVALALIAASGTPIAAPSANLSGRPSPTVPEHVLADLTGRIDALLSAGATGIGVESTVLDLTGPVPTVLRPGGATLEDLAAALGRVEFHPAAAGRVEPDAPLPSPGLRHVHYAPRARMVLVEGADATAIRQAALVLARGAQAQGARVGVLARPGLEWGLPGCLVQPAGARDAIGAVAAGMYAALRELDAAGPDIIIAEAYPEAGLGWAVMNRLRRAAGEISHAAAP